MNYVFSTFIILPLISFFVLQLFANRQEKVIARITQFACIGSLISSIAVLILWLSGNIGSGVHQLVTLYSTEGFTFTLSFYVDPVTIVFGITGAMIFFIVARFSIFYMHRDEGYRRFFSTLLLFAAGYNLIIYSGNFETLFMGWEIIGLSSFLLIAFYRNRYLPVKNAFKVLFIYRISDISLLTAMWLMHHLMHRNISFTELGGAGQGTMAIIVAALIMVAAMAKSAQMPFSSWLPRAMEGPTSSSAIFYGSLSVHIGVFLLLRTYPLWQDMEIIKAAVIVTGGITALAATAVARTQPTAKTLIAYSSIAQIGLMFIEVALGWHVLALVHFAGNAFLRTYQLLVSPSILHYLVHRQYFHSRLVKGSAPGKWKNSLYTLGIKEWSTDRWLRQVLWSPFKIMGRNLHFLESSGGKIMAFLPAVVVVYFLGVGPVEMAGSIVPVACMAIALVLVLYSFASRKSAATAWGYLVFAHFFILGGIMANGERIDPMQVLLYSAGIVPAAVLGFYCLRRTYKADRDINLNIYHGYVYEQKRTALLFLLSAVGLLGFPITTAFIGVDVLFTHIRADQVVMVTLAALSFLFLELAAIRIYCRIYLGIPKNAHVPLAYRST
jgi:NADH:ubiquinone oxidoreductase subunit 5 (subunit L)/multisubunit Na+/H+ antiporter MnhA subunit